MSLRGRIIATMIVLVALGLTAVDIITLSSLHAYLYGRVDSQLNVASDQVERFVLFADAHGHPSTVRGIEDRVSPDIYVEILSSNGLPLVVRPSGIGPQVDPKPLLPTSLPVEPLISREQALRSRGSYRPDIEAIDVPAATGHGPEYRLQAAAIPGGTVIVATRLDSVDATLASLRAIESAVSLGVVVALGLLMILLIRRGFRPLFNMAADADAIAAGDLARRVDPDDERTEMGRLGRALNRMLGQIEEAFAERTMSEERLRRFLADASHELRTPLTSIRGYAELLRKDALDDDAARRKALVRIESEAARMGALVDDLMALARLGEEPQPDVTRVDLVAVVAGAVADARAVDRGRTVALYAPSPVAVAGDEQRVGQIIHNLLQNALAHTPSGTKVEVEVVVESGRAVLRVRDEGPGMDTAQANRIFERFYRGSSSKDAGGSGLGLFIVEAVARALRGYVTVETAVGTGTTFVVVLPVFGAEPVVAGTAGTPEDAGAPTPKDRIGGSAVSGG